MELNFTLNHPALQARQSEEAMNRYIRQNEAFILRCASRVCKRFISKSDDEFEIALVAFWEAVKKYSEQRGSFESFSFLVIKRRLMDYFDSQSRRHQEIPAGHSMTWDGEEDGTQGVTSQVQKILLQDAREDPTAIREEIEALGLVLKDYGFTYMDLAEASPKAAKTKHCCARAVNWMLAAAERVLQMRKSRSLPTSAIEKALDIARKILERHRRYIIAATEILDGDYPHLAEYMDYIRKERSA